MTTADKAFTYAIMKNGGVEGKRWDKETIGFVTVVTCPEPSLFNVIDKLQELHGSVDCSHTTTSCRLIGDNEGCLGAVLESCEYGEMTHVYSGEPYAIKIYDITRGVIGDVWITVLMG